MYGLVKLAAEAQDINLNKSYTAREGRLMDQVDQYLDRKYELDVQRDPAALAERDRLTTKGALMGVGAGAAVGAGAGALTKAGLPGVAIGTIIGGGIGSFPGALYGAIKGDEYYKAHENPELLQKIRAVDNMKIY